MALFSWSMQLIKRSAGRSVVAASAYRAGEKLHDARTGITHDYSRRRGVERAEILVPDGAPQWCQSLKRDELWNLVEATEKRKDSQLARELRIMIPRELPPAERIRVVRDYLREAFVSKGMIADVAWHNLIASDGLEQPHAHVLLTMRNLDAKGFGAKSRHEWIDDPEGRTHPDGRPVKVVSNKASWNCPDYFDRCREDWERIANEALARMGSEERIDRRSLLERGLSRLPEPALRMAWYMRDLYGTMKERFGQYQVAKHYQAVERATKVAMAKLEENPNAPLGRRVHTVHRFYNWFERQLARLEPAPRINEFSRSEGRER
jgi:ATP-dependent exoDNAse (exonuclease V) alpha subunit